MGCALCAEWAENLSKFPNVDVKVNDINDENQEIRWPKKINNYIADERNDGLDTKHKPESVGKAAKAGKPHGAESGQHHNGKNDMAVDGYDDMDTKHRWDSTGEATEAGKRHRAKSWQHFNAKNGIAVKGNDGMDTKHKCDSVGKATKAGKRQGGKSGQHLNGKSDMAVERNDNMVTKHKSDSGGKAAEAETHFLPKWRNNVKSAPPPMKLNDKSSLDVKPKGNWRNASLTKKMQERRDHPDERDEFVVVGVQNERQAEVYINAIQGNTADQIAEAFHAVESILVTGTDTIDELERQGNVIKRANDDIHIADRDINDTKFRLKGMQSLGNKLANIMFRKPPHPTSAQVYKPDNEDKGLKRCSTTPIKLPSRRDLNNEDWINAGMEKLYDALEEVEREEKVIEIKLIQQEGAIGQLDENIDHIEDKIAQNTKLMSSMTRK